MAETPTSWAPTAKVSAGMLAGAVAFIVLAILQGTEWGQQLTKDSKVAGAITTAVTFIVQYLVPERK